MATYKEIHGVKVQYRDTDATAIEGDVWYNASTGLLKMYSAVGAWSTGGTLTTARHYTAGLGTQTAAICVAGTPAAVINEQYDGTSWTEIADLTKGRHGAGAAGTVTAGLAIGANSDPKVVTELYNGTAWTEIGDLNTGRYISSSCGTSTAALIAGGIPAPGPNPHMANSEEFNGTSWAEGDDLNEYASTVQSAGIQTAALCMGGLRDPVGNAGSKKNESYDGSSWTEVGDLNTAHDGGGGFGTQASAICASGRQYYNPTPAQSVNLTKTEEWDGSSFTEIADTSVVMHRTGGSGTVSSAGLLVGTNTSPGNQSEEFTVGASIETVAFD